MEPPAHLDADARIQRACAANDRDEATTLALQTYGSEVFSWLVDRLRGETAGSDAFAIFTEDLWKGWESFEWRCTVRGWSYVLARNAANRVAKKTAAERRRRVNVSSKIGQIADDVRTTTLPHLRTTIKDQFRRLRERLSEEDQLILVLRVDKRLAWTDVAHVVLSTENPSEDELTRESARLRKRLQIIKGKLRELGKESGML